MDYDLPTSHDRNFKELLSHFFIEFVDLFLPDVSKYLDRDAQVVPIDKEIISDIGDGDVHEVDLLMKVKYLGEDAYFLIHVENQATAQSDFPRRMFGYFARLTLKYKLPVYPVVIFSYDTPLRPEPSVYTVAFPGTSVLKFKYRVIQLNRLPWRSFLRHQNPVASALMAKMKMRPQERPKVKAECLRVLANLRLDPAKSRLIGRFIESYLKLTAEEMRLYERTVAAFPLKEKEMTMDTLTYWEQKGLEQGISQGIEQGIEQGKEEFALRLLRRKLGRITPELTTQIESLSSSQIDALGDALLDFATLADLEQWLAQNAKRS